MNAKVRLVFPETLVREPVISKAVRQFDIEVNIRRASVEENYGWIICELDGDRDAVESSMRWFEERGVGVEPLAHVVES